MWPNRQAQQYDSALRTTRRVANRFGRDAPRKLIAPNESVALAAKRGLHLEIEEDRGGVSFPNFISDPAKTPVVDGLGPTGDGMHIRGEFLNLDSLAPRILLLADLLAGLVD